VTLYQLKPEFQRMLRPVAAMFARAGVTANQVTIGTGLGSVAVGGILAIEHRGWVALPLFLFVRMALNAIDGILAREHGQASKLGAVLNELTDVVSDAALTLPFATVEGWNPLLVSGAIFAAALVEFAGVLGGVRRNDGPFGKSDRALALGVLGAWMAVGWGVSAEVKHVAPWVWIALCCATIVQRVRRALG
jgi:CDP-diacylglycerol--glycerol-3-phosphate 3-phosphatidyltransferase